MDSGVIEGGLNVTLTIRLLMHGKVRSPIFCLCDISSLCIYGNVVCVVSFKAGCVNKGIDWVMGSCKQGGVSTLACYCVAYFA